MRSSKLPRIFRHVLTDYCSGDINFTNVYTDDYFRNLIDNGFDSSWIQIPIKELVPFREKANTQQRTNFKRLAGLADRAAKFGVRVFLYSCEPRALYADDPFWNRYPEARGEPGKIGDRPVNSLCTSTEVVKDRIRETACDLFSGIPALGGAFLITASEHQCHCYSHVIIRPGIVFCGKAEHYGISCPRCEKRKATEVVAEALNCFRDGVKMAKTGARVIAWNWSWSMFAADPQTDILKRLKKDIVVMAGFERGGHKIINNKKRFIDEYSLSYVGPSPRFTNICRTSKNLGLKSISKLQLNVTHELATVPNLPLLTNLYKKLDNLRQKNIKSFLGCWNFGCCFTMNTFAIKTFYNLSKKISQDDFVRRVGCDYLGDIDELKFIKAVKAFSRAFNCYPFYRRFTHYGPMSHALSIPIPLKFPGKTELTPPHRNMERGNDWESCFGPYSFAEMISLVEKMSDQWDAALKLFTDTLFPDKNFDPQIWGKGMKSAAITLDNVNKSPQAQLNNFMKKMPKKALETMPIFKTVQGMHRFEEWLSAYTAGACMKSALNLLKAHRLHVRSKAKDQRMQIKEIMCDEIQLVQDLLPLLNIDERLGYHGEAATHLFSPGKIRKKIASMKKE